MKPELLNGANLAFIGDAYYELYIRKYLILKNITNQHELHKLSVKYVSAKGHSMIVEKLEQYFTPTELSMFKRGRNHKYNLSRKNLNMGEYLNSSGFEAVIGYLYLAEENDRLNEILQMAVAIIEENNE